MISPTSVGMGVIIRFIVCVEWVSGLLLSMSRASLCWLYHVLVMLVVPWFPHLYLCWYGCNDLFYCLCGVSLWFNLVIEQGFPMLVMLVVPWFTHLYLCWYGCNDLFYCLCGVSLWFNLVIEQGFPMLVVPWSPHLYLCWYGCNDLFFCLCEVSLWFNLVIEQGFPMLVVPWFPHLYLCWYGCNDLFYCLCGVSLWFNLVIEQGFLCWLYLGPPIYTSVGMGVMICFIVCVEWVSGLTLSLSRASLITSVVWHQARLASHA